MPTVALMLSSCGDGSGGTTKGGSANQGVISTAGLTYGMAPSQNGVLEYQPDVVLVGGGAASIKAASVDGVSWLIDGHAAHAEDIVEGKLMFLTTKAVGRVLHVERRGDDMAVLLGPFDLTEVIRNGHITAHQKVRVSDVITQVRPGAPDAITVLPPGVIPAATSNSGGVTRELIVRPVQFVLAAQGPARQVPTDGLCAVGMDCAQEPKLPPAKPAHSARVDMAPWAFEAEMSGGSAVGSGPEGRETEISVTVGKTIGDKIGKHSEGAEISATLALTFENMSVDYDANIQEGKLVSAYMHVEGLKRARVKLESGSESGRNDKYRLAIPFEFNIPFPGPPVPVNLCIGFSAIIEFAFTSKNSTINSEGEITFDGSPVGFNRSAEGKMVLHNGGAKVTKEPVDHTEGVSVGTTGIVFAAQVEVMGGIGTRVLAVGPFVALTVSIGATDGSSIGIVKCHQASFDVILVTGLRHRMEPAIESYLKRLLPRFTKSETAILSKSTPLVHASKTRPQIALCGE